MNKIAEHYIESSSGKHFHFLEPHPDEIDIEDIAFALSNTCRFNGHVRFYSVAEHSVYVASLLPKELQLTGLLHDAAEAYLSDIPSPIKQFLLDYAKIEKICEAAICERFNLTFPFPDLVKKADRQQLKTEAHYLLPSHGEHWEMWKDQEYEVKNGREPLCLPPHEAYAMFLHVYEKLTSPPKSSILLSTI